MLTTIVSGPSSGRSWGARVVRLCAFTPRNTTSARPIAFSITHCLRFDVEVAVRTDDAESFLLHRAQVRSAGKQHDIAARFREARADVSANGAGPRNRNPHEAFWAYAFATTPRWILPVAVRGMASVM